MQSERCVIVRLENMLKGPSLVQTRARTPSPDLSLIRSPRLSTNPYPCPDWSPSLDQSPAVVNGHIIHIFQVELAMYENLRDVMERRRCLHRSLHDKLQTSISHYSGLLPSVVRIQLLTSY